MRVLITGDDGPPAKVSPYVLGLYQELVKLGWDVAVVIPSSQKSWGGMHFSAHHPFSVWYYYPRSDDPTGSRPDAESAWSATRRPIDKSQGECGEWVLLDASPATCANVGIFNQKLLFPDKPEAPIDLVVSGPNYGRNTGASFALGSGTIGAALAASLAQVKAISVSWGHFAILPKKLKEAQDRLAPAPTSGPANDALSSDGEKKKSFMVAAPPVIEAAHKLTANLIKRLWNEWEPHVGAYTVNVPLAWTLLEPKVVWTTMWDGKHGRLFDSDEPGKSFWLPSDLKKDHGSTEHAHQPSFAPKAELKLRFSPDMPAMLAPKEPKEGTDIWALVNGWVSVTRLRPAFAEVLPPEALQEAKVDALGQKGPGVVWRL